jgi:hypothetical protein
MPRFVIEVSQPADGLARRRIDQALNGMGSHFASHADWRREHGRFTGTMIVEASDSSEVAGIVPPSLRSQTRVYRLELAEAA